MNPEILKLAREAVEQHERATPGPLVLAPFDIHNDGRIDIEDEGCNGFPVEIQVCNGHGFGQTVSERQLPPGTEPDEYLNGADCETQAALDTARWICAARSREPLLAKALLALGDARDEEVERLRAVAVAAQKLLDTQEAIKRERGQSFTSVMSAYEAATLRGALYAPSSPAPAPATNT